MNRGLPVDRHQGSTKCVLAFDFHLDPILMSSEQIQRLYVLAGDEIMVARSKVKAHKAASFKRAYLLLIDV